MVTQFTFDFFAPDRLWKAYNMLALSILDGRLDIPYEAIGREGNYYQGKAYMYYGMFPVLIRFILTPFIDLNVTPVSRISVWVMTTIGAAALQYCLLLLFNNRKKIEEHVSQLVLLAVFSALVWFGGAHFIIVQAASIFYEPYAAMLMLSSVFLAVAARDIFCSTGERKYQLIVYALIAAFSIHTRLTVAISLYSATAVLILMSALDEQSKFATKQPTILDYCKRAIRAGFWPSTILLLGGVSIFVINYIKFDDFLAITKGTYGETLAGEGMSPRVCSRLVTGEGPFELGRIIPNLVHYTIGGWDFHSAWIKKLGLGYVRKELPDVRLALLWTGSIGIFIGACGLIIRKAIVSKSMMDIFTFIFFISLLVSSFLILSYQTLALRYIADLWLPLGFTTLFAFNSLIGGQYFHFKNTRNRMLFAVFSLICILNFVYAGYVYSKYGYYTQLENDGLPTAELLEQLRNPTLQAIDLSECDQYEF